MKATYFIYILSLFLWSAPLHAQPGLPDPGFGGGDGLVTTSFFPDYHAQGNSVMVQEDGKILVAGNTWLPFGSDFAFLNRYLPDGSPDESFNGSGQFLFQEWDIYASSHAVTVQPDGKIVCALKRVESQETVALIYRLHPDGSPDTSFGIGGIVTKSFGARYLGVGALTLQSDGKMVIGGYMRFENDTFSQTFICRFMPDGMPDNSFDGDGAVVKRIGERYAVYSAIMIQEDGKIIAAGYADYNQYDDFIAVRYNPNGTPDQTFSGDGVASAAFSNQDDSGYDAILQPDGKVVVGGTAYNMMAGRYEFAAVRFNSDGSPDNSFHNDGKVTIALTGFGDGARAMLLQPDGKIVLGGYAHSTITGGADMALIRLNANGTPDFTFSGDGIAVYEDDISTSSGIEALALQPDGKIVGTGFSRTNEIKSICVTRFLSGITVSTNEMHLPELDLSLYPNPVIDDVFISYDLVSSETISVYLSDIEGKFVQRLLAPAERSAGKHNEHLVLNRPLTPGIYFINIASAHWITSVKVMVE